MATALWDCIPPPPFCSLRQMATTDLFGPLVHWLPHVLVYTVFLLLLQPFVTFPTPAHFWWNCIWASLFCFAALPFVHKSIMSLGTAICLTAALPLIPGP